MFLCQIPKINKTQLSYFFSSTLDILKKNRAALKTIDKSKHKSQSLQNTQKPTNTLTLQQLQNYKSFSHQILPPYQSTHHEYLNNYPHLLLTNSTSPNNNKSIYLSIPLLQEIQKYFTPNEAISNFSGDPQEINDFVLLKVMHIALKTLEKQREDPSCVEENKKLWQNISDRIEILYRNPSINDNVLIMLVCYSKKQHFSQQFARKVLKLLADELKFMTEKEKQLTFYLLTKLKIIRERELAQQKNKGQKSQSDEIQTEILDLKKQIIESLSHMRMHLSSMRIWIALHSLCNASPYSLIFNHYNRYLKILHKFKADRQKKYKKISSQEIADNQKINEQKSVECLLACLNHQNILNTPRNIYYVEKMTERILEEYPDIIVKMLKKEENENIRLKMYLSINNINDSSFTLTNQQLCRDELSTGQKLAYIYKLWKYEIKQPYELQSLYESTQITNIDSMKVFANIHEIYYSIVLELAFSTNNSFKKILHWLQQIDYVPRGMEFQVACYLKNIQEQCSDILKSQQNSPQKMQQAQQTLKKLMDLSSQLNTKNKKFDKFSSLLSEIKLQQKNNSNISQLSKFFKSILVYDFTELTFITPAHYLTHFCSEKYKIVLHCAQPEDFLYSKVGPINLLHNEFLLRKNLLHKYFGYDVLVINTEQFLEMGYNDRVNWLKNSISQILNQRKNNEREKLTSAEKVEQKITGS